MLGGQKLGVMLKNIWFHHGVAHHLDCHVLTRHPQQKFVEDIYL